MTRRDARLKPAAVRHRLFVWVSRTTDKAGLLVPLMAAFMLGVFTNALSDPSIRNAWDAVLRVYDLQARPIAWASVVATVTVVLLPVGRYLLERWARTDQFAIRLAALYERYIADDLRPYAAGRIAWGTALVLQSCPNLEAGWKPSEVTVIRRPTSFVLAADEVAAFDRWVAEQEPRGVNLRGTKYMLVKDPSSFSDASGLDLAVQECSYAQARFYAHGQAAIPAVRRRRVEQVDGGPIGFPHSLTLHATVATADGFVLLTRRSNKVDYYPGVWSCSIEEQLSTVDFPAGVGPADVMEVWAVRMLREELGLESTHVSADNIRVSGVFLESDVLNCSLAALVTLNVDRASLEAIIRRHPRQDYEYTEWHFLPWARLPSELLHPTFDFHPTAGLRMFLAGVMRFGAREFGVRLDRESGR
jgi:hypothetical protein